MTEILAPRFTKFPILRLVVSYSPIRNEKQSSPNSLSKKVDLVNKKDER